MNAQGGLEMLSDEEQEDEDPDSDQDAVDEFPEIDAASDSDDASYGIDEEEDGSDEDDEIEGQEDGEEDLSEDESDEDFRIFPKSKTVISDITGELKKVYPEIEPDYDSDSSTEDVRSAVLLVCLTFILFA